MTANQPRVHLTIGFDDADLPAIAEARRQWDPDMARGVPPHVTLAYPEEFDAETLLVYRAADAATKFGPFSMHASGVFVDGDDGIGGLFCAVSDPSKSWAGLRRLILQPPFSPHDVAPHITIVHPRTSARGAQAWDALRGSEFDYPLTVTEFYLTSTAVSTGMTIRRRFRLS